MNIRTYSSNLPSRDWYLEINDASVFLNSTNYDSGRTIELVITSLQN